MTIIAVNEVGKLGVVSDTKPHELALNAWTDCLNMRMRDGAVERIKGWGQELSGNTIAPIYGGEILSSAGTMTKFIASLAKVHATTTGSYSDITRVSGGDYAATADLNWTHATLSGIVILNNGVDAPQSWNPVSPSTPLVALPNWPASTTCKSMREFKNYLIALDVTKTGTRYPYLLKWSHPADPGTVPTSWDQTDATKDAGELDVAQTNDFVVDSLSLRDAHMIYKENSVWAIQATGGTEIFRLYRVFGESGILSRRCAVEIPDGRHVVFGDTDCYVHDGQQAQSLLTRKMRKWLYSRIDTATYMRSFASLSPATNEVWFCFPELGELYPTKAVTWNWVENTLSIREIPTLAHIFLTRGLSVPWESDTSVWTGDSSSWDVTVFNPTGARPMGVAYSDSKVIGLEAGVSASGSAMQAYIERTALGIPIRVGAPPDFSTMKYIRNVWPRIDGEAGRVVYMDIGGQKDLNSAVEWVHTREYTIGTTQKLDCLLSTRLPAIRFRSEENFAWTLHGYELDLDFVGGF